MQAVPQFRFSTRRPGTDGTQSRTESSGVLTTGTDETRGPLLANSAAVAPTIGHPRSPSRSRETRCLSYWRCEWISGVIAASRTRKVHRRRPAMDGYDYGGPRRGRSRPRGEGHDRRPLARLRPEDGRPCSACHDRNARPLAVELLIIGCRPVIRCSTAVVPARAATTGSASLREDGSERYSRPRFRQAVRVRRSRSRLRGDGHTRPRPARCRVLAVGNPDYEDSVRLRQRREGRAARRPFVDDAISGTESGSLGGGGPSGNVSVVGAAVRGRHRPRAGSYPGSRPAHSAPGGWRRQASATTGQHAAAATATAATRVPNATAPAR